MNLADLQQALAPFHSGFFRAKEGPTEHDKKAPATASLSNQLAIDQVYHSKGILGKLNENVVMVDTDTAEDSAALQRVLAALGLVVPMMKTTKGFHFYFKKTNIKLAANTNTKVACGVLVDFKLGARNGLDVIKYDGQWREWFNMSAPLIELPPVLYPVKTTGERTSFTKLVEGSRNNELYTYVGTLKRAHFSMSEVHQMLTLINNCVLPDPLPQSDIDNIARSDSYNGALGDLGKGASKKPKAAKKDAADTGGGDSGDGGEPRKTCEDYAREIVACHDYGYYKGTLYEKREGVYTPLDKGDLIKIIYPFVPDCTVTKRRDIIDQMIFFARTFDLTEDTTKDPHLIPFDNGVLDLNTLNLMSYDDCSLPFFSKIPHEFAKAEGHCFTAEKFLNDVACGDQQIITSLLEMIGACFYRRNALRGIFILLGGKHNGKSTFIDWLAYLLGPRNYSSIPFDKLNGQYLGASLLGKFANISDEIKSGYIGEPETIKAIATSNIIFSEVKYQEPLSFRPFSTLICTANSLPSIKDPTGAVLDRLIPIPFKASFRGANDNVNMLEQLCHEDIAQWVIYQALLAFRKALVNRGYTKGNGTQAITTQYANTNNPIKFFLTEEFDDLEAALNNVSTKDIYEHYQNFCIQEKLYDNGRNKFSSGMLEVVSNLAIVRKRLTNQITGQVTRISLFAKIDPTKPITLMD